MNEFNESNYGNEIQGGGERPENLRQKPKDKIKTVSWQDENGVHTHTTVIHKNVPSVWTILITAVTFLLIGALIATAMWFANFTGLIAFNPDFSGRTGEIPVTDNPNNPKNTNPPLTTAQPTAPPSQQGGNPGVIFGGENPIPALYNEVVDGVVIVRAYSSNRKSQYDVIGVGAGFFISEDGYILTNAHVVKGAVSVWVALHDGTEIKAETIGADFKSDVAALKIKTEKPVKALQIGDSGSVAIGDFVFAIGHPTGEELSFTLTFGTVGAIGRPVLIDGISNTYIQLDAAINPGNSGGPLFNMKGEVVGINSAKTIDAGYDENGKTISAEGLGFALPINDAMTVARQLIAEGGIERPGIGVSVITIDEELASEYNIPQGALVYSVIKDGPAHKAGLYADDIIVKANGTQVTDKDVFVSIIQKLKVGDSVEIEFWRRGEIKKCTLVIGNFNELGSEILDNAYGGSGFGFGGNP